LLANCHHGDAIRFNALLAEFGDYRFGVGRQTAYTDNRVFRRHISPNPMHAKVHFPGVHPAAMGRRQTAAHKDSFGPDPLLSSVAAATSMAPKTGAQPPGAEALAHSPTECRFIEQQSGEVP
jgi:hypothetical protein